MKNGAFVLLLVLLSGLIVFAQDATLDRIVDHFVLDTITVSPSDLSADGKWLVVTAASLRDRIGINNYRFGDPAYIAPSVSEVRIIDTASGKSQNLFPVKQQVRGFKWSPDNGKLAFFLLKGEAFEPQVWDRVAGRVQTITLPAGKEAADNAEIEWLPGSSEVMFAVRAKTWREEAKKRFEQETKATVVVHSSDEPFLTWEDVRRMSAQRSVVAVNVTSGRSREVLPEMRISSYNVVEDGSTLTYAEDITRKTDYDTIMGVENQIQSKPAGGGSSALLIKSTKGLSLIWSRDQKRYAYSKDGKIWIGSAQGGEPRQIAGKVDDASKKEDGANKADAKDEEKFSAVRLSPHGERLVASDKKGLWLIETASGAKDLFIPMPEEDKESPRYQVVEWSDDGAHLYLTYNSRKAWDRGLVRYDVDARKLVDLIRDSRIYSNVRLARNGSILVFTAAEGNRPADIFAADADFKNVRRLTTDNPKFADRPIAKTDLLSYLDVDGNKLYGVVYYPTDYQPGKKYPVVFNIYEDFFDDTFNGTINVLTSNGYVVVQPSVHLEIGYPGESWMKGVTAAANKLIDMGVADPDRLGVQGTSYGGYATNLLITQTNRFRAAINISGKVDMISFYTDSPRLGDRNTHAPEKSQDRIGGTLWQQQQKYIQHSAIMFADRIKTPIMLMNGDQDQNVPPRQLMEMYYALRRLGKEVKWVVYTNGGHGMPTSTVGEVYDYHRQIVGWWNDHLKGDLKKKTTDSSSAGAKQD